MYFKHLKLIF